MSLYPSTVTLNKFLNFCEVVFDQVPPLVHVGIVISLHLSVRFGRNDSDSTALIKFLQEPVYVKGFIGQKRSKGNVANERGDPFHVLRPSGQKQKAEQVSERINHANNLGVQPATRAPDGMMLSPPFCARILLVGLNLNSAIGV